MKPYSQMMSQYICYMINLDIEQNRIYYHTKAEELANSIFTHEYLNKIKKKPIDRLNHQIFLKNLYFRFAYFQGIQNQNKKLIQITKKSWQELNNTKKSIKTTDKNALIKEKERIDRIISTHQSQIQPQTQQDQISKQLNKLTKELIKINHDNRPRLDRLIKKVKQQNKNDKNLICESQKSKKQTYKNPIYNLINSQRIKLQIQCFLTHIIYIQKMQVAESICKILYTKKQKKDNKIEYKYVVSFQSALHFKNYAFTQEQLTVLNGVRKKSLFESYYCQIDHQLEISPCYIQCGQIYRHQQVTNQIGNIFKQMKMKLSESEQVDQFMKKFQMCHHCKFLCQKQILVKCKYRYKDSKLNLINENKNILAQIQSNMDSFERESSVRNAQKVCQMKMSHFQRNPKKDDKYYCDKLYCKDCLNSSYPELKVNGICPYCSGICHCTRCMRDQNIKKLKAFYLLYGGENQEILNRSLLQKIYLEPKQPKIQQNQTQYKKAIMRLELKQLNRKKELRPKSFDYSSKKYEKTIQKTTLKSKQQKKRVHKQLQNEKEDDEVNVKIGKRKRYKTTIFDL